MSDTFKPSAKISLSDLPDLMTIKEVAMGSSDETITHDREIMILAETFKRLNNQLCQCVIDEYKIISKQLNNMIKKWTNFR